jgi:hypothetical protein
VCLRHTLGGSVEARACPAKWISRRHILPRWSSSRSKSSRRTRSQNRRSLFERLTAVILSRADGEGPRLLAGVPVGTQAVSEAIASQNSGRLVCRPLRCEIGRRASPPQDDKVSAGERVDNAPRFPLAPSRFLPTVSAI